MSVHDDTLQGLQEILDYVKGDKTKARSMTITIEDEEIESNQLLYQKIVELPKPDKEKAMQYVDELLQASGQ